MYELRDMQNSSVFREEALQGKRCVYCGGNTELVDDTEVYSKSYGTKIYLCRDCDAYVGCHIGTTKAKGTVANKELRRKRILAHQAFDKIAKTDLIHTIYPKKIPVRNRREKAYFWLAQELGIDFADCHIGMMDEEQCEKVRTISLNAISKNNDDDKRTGK